MRSKHISIFLRFCFTIAVLSSGGEHALAQENPTRFTCVWTPNQASQLQIETIELGILYEKKEIRFSFQNKPRSETDLNSPVNPFSATVDSATGFYTETNVTYPGSRETTYTVNLYEQGIYAFRDFSEERKERKYTLLHYPPLVGPAQTRRVFNCTFYVKK